MKKTFFKLSFIAIVCMTLSNFSIGQTNKVIPIVDITTVNNEATSTSVFENGGKPYVIVVWETWSKPAAMELMMLNDLQEDWNSSFGAKVIIVSVDDPRNASKVKPFLANKNLEFESYKDPSQNLKSALNLKGEDIPTTYILNSKKQIVWTKIGYEPGDENAISDKLKSLGSTGVVASKGGSKSKCSTPMEAGPYDDMLKTLYDLSRKVENNYSYLKVSDATESIRDNCLSAFQIKQVMMLFDYDRDKYEYAKFALSSITNISEVGILEEMFKDESYWKSFQRHIENYKTTQ